MSKRGWPHVDDQFKVGERLRKARLKARLSMNGLSFPGCSATYICRIEKGVRVPSLQVLRELANRVGVDEDWLAMGKGSMRTTLVTRRLNPTQLKNLEVFGDITDDERPIIGQRVEEMLAVLRKKRQRRPS